MSYTRPDKNDISFTVGTGYSAPASNGVDFEIGTETEPTGLSDMAMDIKVFRSSVADARLDITAAYQAIVSCPVDVSALSEKLQYQMMDISAGLLYITDLQLSVMFAKEINLDAVLDIILSTGIITNNMAMDINVGDGNKRQDFGIDIMAVTSRPAFRYVYAMNLSSVIKEIAS